MNKYLIIGLFAGSLQGCSGIESSQNAETPPNVIFIYADDLGRGLLSHYGQKFISTPNIDRIANEGISFENVRGCMFCAPARASLLSGYHDCHGDKWQITAGAAYISVSTHDESPFDISRQLYAQTNGHREDIMYMAQVFKKAGYTTGQVGKLEWGFSVSMEEMEAHGWDYYYGYLDHVRAHGFYPPFLFECGDTVHISGNTRADCGKTLERETEETFRERWNMEGKEIYSQNLFIEKAISFIRDNKDKPFFLYHPTPLPHGPVAIPEVHPDFLKDNRLTQIEKEYASMIKLLDDHFALLMKELEVLNLNNNTMIIFSSDNGHEIYYSQEGRILKPVRNMKTGERFDNISTKYYSELGGDVFDGNHGMAGIKRDNWEGGLRIPLFIRWPGKIQAGSVSDNLIAAYDLLPTFADMLNIDLSDKKDGISLLPLLLGNDDVEHEYVVNASMMGASLVTKEGWKLRHFYPHDLFQLYYLPDDYKEKRDLAKDNPDIVENLKEIIIRECNGNLSNGYFTYQKFVLPKL